MQYAKAQKWLAKNFGQKIKIFKRNDQNNLKKEVKWVYDLSPNASLPNQVCLMQVPHPYKFADYELQTRSMKKFVVQ